MKRFLLTIVASLASIALYAQAPTITSFLPTNARAGETITITGTGFDSTISNNIVFFGTVKAPVVSSTSTEIVVTVPNGATHSLLNVINLTTSLSASSPLY
ncbi:MAG: IPT/TIG domain-containing protein, partial [Flavobacteriaceae bacterium]|nr:IPT/TIG domain-containing protein [Flavobacteriaceae bacterium]